MKQSVRKIGAGTDLLNSARELYKEYEVALEGYLDLLLEWNEKINLVSRTVSRETVREHVVHSLLPLPLGLLGSHREWIDAGSGGGLPGIPLAICENALSIILNDNVRKKMRAVDDIVERAGLQNCSIAAKSISLIDLKKGTGLVSKHAFKIPDLIRLLGKKPWQTILLWKGAEDAEKEIRQLRIKVKATIYSFEFGPGESFYEGKGLVLIQR